MNRVIDAAVKLAKDAGEKIEKVSVHDLRRTASTLLHEAGFNSDWIEKCLAHEQRGVRAVYNKAEYAEQRRDMIQQWADMIDEWLNKQEFKFYLSFHLVSITSKFHLVFIFCSRFQILY